MNAIDRSDALHWSIIKLHNNLLVHKHNRAIIVTTDCNKQSTTYWALSSVGSIFTPSTKLSKDSAALCFAFFFDVPETDTDLTGHYLQQCITSTRKPTWWGQEGDLAWAYSRLPTC